MIAWPLRRGRAALHAGPPVLAVAGADGARFVPEHARVAALMPARVDKLSLFTLVKGHVTTGTGCATGFVFEQLS